MYIFAKEIEEKSGASGTRVSARFDSSCEAMNLFPLTGVSTKRWR